MRHTYHFWPVIDRRYYTTIGHVVVVWAFLETEIDHHIETSNGARRCGSN